MSITAPIPLETLISLYQKDMSVQDIAAKVGCSRQNVHMRLVKAGVRSVTTFKKMRADMFAVLQSQILNSINAKDLKKANLSQKASATGILYDKERLERGQSTENVDVHEEIAALKKAENVEKA